MSNKEKTYCCAPYLPVVRQGATTVIRNRAGTRAKSQSRWLT